MVTQAAGQVLRGAGDVSPSGQFAQIGGTQLAGIGVNPYAINPATGMPTGFVAAPRAELRGAEKILPTVVAAVRKDGYQKDARQRREEKEKFAPQQAEGVAPPREIKQDETTQAIGTVGTAGNVVMQAEMLAPLAGMAFRNTIGQLSPTLRQGIGAITYAPFKALWNISVKDLLTGNWRTMKGNYYKALYDYTAGVPFAKPAEEVGTGFLSALNKNRANYTPWEGLKEKAAKYGVTEIKELDKVGGSVFNRIWNGRAYGVALKAGLGAASIYLGIKAYSHIRHSIAMAQELGRDFYGKEFSTWDILMNPSSLPTLMQEVRGNMVAHATPEVAKVVGETAQNWSFWNGMHDMGGMLRQAAMFGGMMVTMSADKLKPSENFLESYTRLKDTHKSGQRAPVELYALLVEAASVDARRAGGVKSKLIQTIAEGYAREQKPAIEVLKEIDGKTAYVKRAQEAAEKIKAEEAARPKPKHDKPIVKKEEHKEAAHTHSKKDDKPSLKIAGDGLANHGKLQSKQMAAEV